MPPKLNWLAELTMMKKSKLKDCEAERTAMMENIKQQRKLAAMEAVRKMFAEANEIDSLDEFPAGNISLQSLLYIKNH